MRATRLVIRSAAGLFAATVVATAWRASGPPATYRAAARLAITEDAAADVPGEIAALKRYAGRAHVAVVSDAANVIEISLDAGDPLAAVEAADTVVDEYLRTRRSERARRAAAMLAETEARVKKQAGVVRRLERDLAGAQTVLARVRRDRQSAASHLRNLERSIGRAQERLAELEPLVAHIRSGRPAEHLSVVQNTLDVQALQARVAGLDGERAALLARYGPAHPQLQRNAADRAAVVARLQTEIANIAGMVTHDYETTRLDKQWLEGERDKALLLSTQPLPSRGEYESLFRRAQEERAAHAASVRRQQELQDIVQVPGPGVTLVERVPPVRNTPGHPSPWPWAIGLLAAVAVLFAARAVVRRRSARTEPERFHVVREKPRATEETRSSVPANLRKTA